MGELSRGDFICLVSPKKHAGQVLQEAQIPSGDAEGPTSQEHQGPTDLDRDLSQSPLAFLHSYLELGNSLLYLLNPWRVMRLFQ